METRLPATATARRQLTLLDGLVLALAFVGGFLISWFLSGQVLLWSALIFALGIGATLLFRRGQRWFPVATAVWLSFQVVDLIAGAQAGKLGNGEWWLDSVMIALLMYAFAALPALIGASLAPRVYHTKRER